MNKKPAYEELVQRVHVLEQAELKLSHIQKRNRAWLENSPVCTKILDLDFKLQYMSYAGAKLLKVNDVTKYYGQSYPLDFYPELFQESMNESLNEALTSKKIVTQELSILDNEKNKLWFHSTIVPVCADNGGVEYIMVVSIDTTARKRAELDLAKLNENLEFKIKQRTAELSNEISERKKIERQITHLATHDSLTNLPNRHLLIDRLDHAFTSARRDHSKVAILFVDLDSFKQINDALGHMKGDLTLIEMANRMTSCLREKDTVARFGGDEFVIVMTDVNHKGDVSVLAEKLCKSLHKPITLDGKQYEIGSSIGIALYPDHGQSTDKLLSSADDAMYRIKKSGKNGYAFSE